MKKPVCKKIRSIASLMREELHPDGRLINHYLRLKKRYKSHRQAGLLKYVRQHSHGKKMVLATNAILSQFPVKFQ